MRIVIRLAGLALVVAGVTSCGSVVRDGSSPVYLVIDQLVGFRGGATGGTGTTTLASDVLTIIRKGSGGCTADAGCPTVFGDAGSVTLRAPLKDIGNGSTTLSPTTNNEVTITQYHVKYIRADGRDVPGVDVPFAFDGAVTGTIPAANGTLSIGFDLVRNVAKGEAPLVGLTGSANLISTIAEVTFYGKDRVGNNVSVTGRLNVTFGDFGDQ